MVKLNPNSMIILIGLNWSKLTTIQMFNTFNID